MLKKNKFMLIYTSLMNIGFDKFMYRNILRARINMIEFIILRRYNTSTREDLMKDIVTRRVREICLDYCTHELLHERG